jgi:hypothetical protein
MNELDPGFDLEHPFLARIDEIGFENLRKNPECQAFKIVTNNVHNCV